MTSVESIASLRHGVASGAVSISDVKRRVADRVSAHSALNAFITVMIGDAADDADPHLPLAGIPIGVKDFFDTAGIRTTAGFVHFANRIPAEDAVLVRKLRAAGAMLVGKTNMHCLGMGTTSLESHFGPVRNPLMPDHVAGGSSGGSAAAVAAGLCLATIDTDAAGSARLPAACCGVAAFKPSFGMLSGEGVLKGEPADPAILKLSHASLIARDAHDAAVVFMLLADGEPGVRRAGRRVGIAANAMGDPSVKAAFEASLPALLAPAASTRACLIPFDEAQFDVTGLEDARNRINDQLFSEIDLLVLPTLAGPVPTIAEAQRIGEMAVSTANTFFANYFGLPAIAIPIKVEGFPAPISVQIIGPRGADLAVLDYAKAVEAALPPAMTFPRFWEQPAPAGNGSAPR